MNYRLLAIEMLKQYYYDIRDIPLEDIKNTIKYIRDDEYSVFKENAIPCMFIEKAKKRCNIEIDIIRG